MNYSPPIWIFSGLLSAGLIVSVILSVREQIGKYNLQMLTCKGRGWSYVYGGDNPNGIVAFVNLEMLNKGSERCKIKPKMMIVHSGSKCISRDLPIIDLDGNDPNKTDIKNKYEVELTTFVIPVSHNVFSGETLQATLILCCWNDRKWVFGRKTKCRHIELPHDQKLMQEIAFGRR